MSMFHPRTVKCGCGATFVANLADTVNVRRTPDIRKEILAGTFHRVTCPACQRQVTVEKDFFYIDPDRNTFIQVKPVGDRHLWQEASVALDHNVQYKVPAAVFPSEERTLRVVFGLEELREKLVAQDANLDDRLAELAKVFVAYEHPFLLQRARLRLLLTDVTTDNVHFAACYDHAPNRYRIDLPREIADGIVARRDEMERWVTDQHARSNVFALGNDHWVNLWRWSPQTWALSSLHDYATAIGQGQMVDHESPQYRSMVKYLPRGKHLPGWAKQDLQVLFRDAKDRNLGQLQDTLFEIRFDITLEDDWALNDDPEDIDTLWKLLKGLPETNVEGNTAIDELLLDEGKGGGMYFPQSHQILIGSVQLGNQEGFEDVVRHEVGHGVHEMFQSIVDPWLAETFGWQRFGTQGPEIDQWVALMGGWGDLDAAQQNEVRTYLIEALGAGSSWDAGPAPAPPADHPWWRADFGPRLAYESTGSNWYSRNPSWYRANGKAFFLNYWYQSLMVVDEKALELINAGMPSKYAAMSPLEFFAEIYALYYDLDDPQRGNLPPAAVQWLDEHIGRAESGAPASGLAGLAPAHRSGGAGIPRPGRPDVGG